MAQNKHEHLTIAQLSAYLDQELSSGELALCDAHLSICPLCQAALADLRLTSALLHGLPQVEVPRSFVLPTNIAVLPETPAHEASRRTDRSQYLWKSTLRALSTLAAVLGVIFILMGAVTALHPQVLATNSASYSQTAQGQQHAPTTPTGPNVAGASSTPGAHTADPGKTPFADKATPVVTPQPNPRQPARPDDQSGGAEPPPVLDLGKPEGRLGIGSTLFALGILGVLLTRRFRRDPA